MVPTASAGEYQFTLNFLPLEGEKINFFSFEPQIMELFYTVA